MADVACRRCHQTQEGVSDIPYGGPLGDTLRATVCRVCWQAWCDMSVKIVNEYRLNLSEPSARTFVSTQMKIFLGLIPSPDGAPIKIDDTPVAHSGVSGA